MSKYIKPTVDSPVFTAECDYFGFIECGAYKMHSVQSPNEEWETIGDTWAIGYHDAIVNLHEWIRDNPQVLKDYPKAKFHIRLVDGRWNQKLDQKREETVYTISAKKAKRLLSLSYLED